MHEVKQLLWQCGLFKPRLRGLSVTETEDRRIAVLQDGAKRGHVARTKRKHKVAAGAAGNDPGWTLWHILVYLELSRDIPNLDYLS